MKNGLYVLELRLHVGPTDKMSTTLDRKMVDLSGIYSETFQKRMRGGGPTRGSVSAALLRQTLGGFCSALQPRPCIAAWISASHRLVGLRWVWEREGQTSHFGLEPGRIQ